MSRYLTSQEKEATVNFWLLSREATKPTTDLAREHVLMGGFDWPDPPIFPYTDRLNALDGVCTISSCMGHRHLKDYEFFSEGYIWFRLSQGNTKIFDKQVPELIRMDEVVRARRSYSLAESTHFWEWYEVEFRGGETTLPGIIEPIIRFFERIFPTMHPVPEREDETQQDLVRSVPAHPVEEAGITGKTCRTGKIVSGSSTESD